MTDQTASWIAADRRHAWHPFTDQAEWEKSDPLILTRGEGVWLFDSEGKRYLDANSSIWTNIHGHGNPKIVAAIQEQAARLCHSSFLGFTNDKASELAERLCAFFPNQLTRCFFSDDGSTALEVALKMSLQWSQQNGKEERTGVIAFDHAYHGDTLGASSVKVFVFVTLPLSLPGILAGAVVGFAKALGEFGATITFVSNIPGETQTIASAIYALLQVPGQEAAVGRMIGFSILLSFGALLLSGVLARRMVRR